MDLVYEIVNFFIIGVISYFLFIHFREFDHISLKEHWGVILFTIILMIGLLVAWRLFFNNISTFMHNMNYYQDKQMKWDING